MSCNGCGQKFTFLRREKGCPSCGFSYCSKCLTFKLFLDKLDAEVKVCSRCMLTAEKKSEDKIVAPDAYYKRTAIHPMNIPSSSSNPQDDEIQRRLKKLKDDALEAITPPTIEEITQRLKVIKDVPITEAELQDRLAKLKDNPTVSNNTKLTTEPKLSTEESVDVLMRQFMEQSQIDARYEDKLNQVLNDIQNRLQKLKEKDGQKNDTIEQPKEVSSKMFYLKELHTELDETDSLMKHIMEQSKMDANRDDKLIEVLQSIQKRINSIKKDDKSGNKVIVEDCDDEDEINQIVKKYTSQALIENSNEQVNEELPFCEICNEDATLRCLGCRYLFCNTCFHEHKDDDDGCDRYEVFKLNKVG